MVVPYSMSLSNNGNDVSINYTTVTTNKEIDPAIFVMPAKDNGEHTRKMDTIVFEQYQNIQ